MSDRALRPVLRERKDIGVRFMLALLAGIGACLLLMLAIGYFRFPKELADRKFAQPFPQFPAPQLQPSPRIDMGTFYAEEMKHLNSAGWQDKAAGTMHIPIDQAMRDIAAEGIPGWPSSADQSEGDRSEGDRSKGDRR